MKKALLITYATLWVTFNLITLSSCKKTDIGTPKENEVFLLYKAFSPSQLSIQVGDTVTFINKDNASHTVTSTGVFDSGKLKTNQSYSFTFNIAGTYYFYCNYHSSVSQEQGAIIVN